MLSDGTLLKSSPKTNRKASRKLLVLIWLSCSFAVHFRKTFLQGTIGQHCVGPKLSFTDEMFGSNLFLSDKIVTHIFVIVKTNAFGIDGGRLVLGLFYILNM